MVIFNDQQAFTNDIRLGKLSSLIDPDRENTAKKIYEFL
jgi:hypothetical protein